MQYTRVVLLAQITAFATGMNVTLINETPLPLQVYSVDPATHKTHDTICKLDSNPCSVNQDFIVVHETGQQRGDFFDAWYGDGWKDAHETFSVALDQTSPDYLQYAPSSSALVSDLVAENSTVGSLTCHSISKSASTTWCNANCNHNPPFCPSNMCQCSAGPAPPPPPETECLHNEDSHKCYEACATGKFAMKGFTLPGKCEAKYSVVGSKTEEFQCPDGVTNIKYCPLTLVAVTVVTKGVGR